MINESIHLNLPGTLSTGSAILKNLRTKKVSNAPLVPGAWKMNTVSFCVTGIFPYHFKTLENQGRKRLAP